MEKENKPNEINYISTSGVYKTPFALIIVLQLFIGGIVLVLANLWFVNHLYFLLTGRQFYPLDPKGEWYDWLLLPLNVYGNLMLFAFSIILFSAIINNFILHPPIEGVFDKGSKEWKNMHRRFWLAYFPIWLARSLPLPWADIVCYRFFGVKVGKNVVAYEGYIDPGLVDIGDFTMTSLHICIFSHNIYHDKVVIKKVSIGRNCIVGPQTIISPGTTMNEGAILGANSYTWIGQELAGNLIHVGTPVNFSFPISSVDKSKEKAEKIKSVNLDDNSLEPKIEGGQKG